MNTCRVKQCNILINVALSVQPGFVDEKLVSIFILAMIFFYDVMVMSQTFSYELFFRLDKDIYCTMYVQYIHCLTHCKTDIVVQ